MNIICSQIQSILLSQGKTLSTFSALPAPNSIEDTILRTLQTEGSLITRELRALCGFEGGKMRGTFDGYVTRLQMAK